MYVCAFISAYGWMNGWTYIDIVKCGGVRILVSSCEAKISARQLETSTRTLLRIASSNTQSIRELVQDGAIQALVGRHRNIPCFVYGGVCGLRVCDVLNTLSVCVSICQLCLFTCSWRCLYSVQVLCNSKRSLQMQQSKPAEATSRSYPTRYML